VDPEAVVARIWPGRRAEVEPLGGGITNHNFKVTLDGEAYVLRIGGKDTSLLGINRADEHAASLVASRSGIGPEVVRFVEPEGFLVTRFVTGRPVPPEKMRTRRNLERVAALLRAVHDGATIPGRFDPFRVVETYRKTAIAHGVKIPHAFGPAKRLADEIERTRPEATTHPCHNDLLNANFIEDETGLRLVDWEYAGMGDRFFDLANFSVNHDLDPSEDRVLLDAYFGKEREEDVAALTLMRFMSDFREAMWGVVQQAISTLDFDFDSYSREHFERLGKAAAEPRFRHALQTTQAQPSQ
jgi:thiamine kinase-like enzyme